MKTFNILAVVSLLIAFAGIMYTGGKANVISYASVVPLAVFVLILLVNGTISFVKDFKSNKPQ